jgi:CheY-like chemotaxis protein
MRSDADAAAPRVLLVADLDSAERGVAEALGARGLRVRSAAGAAEGVRILRDEGADVVVLALPLGGVDPIAACAALKEGPYAPSLVLADAADQTSALSASLPDSCRPDAVLPRPLEAAKLAIAIHECLQAGANAEEGAALGISLAELLVDLKRRRVTEVLELRAAGVCSSIYLREGDPIFAEGGSLQETLGRQLVRRGAIGQDDYSRVVERMTEGVIHHQSLRLGEVLAELGLLSAAEVYDALALQVREKIVACFQWESFAYELHEALDEPEDLGIYQCPPSEALVLAGIRAHYGPDRLEGVLGGQAEMFPVLRTSAESLVPLYQPTAAEQELIRAIDGTQSLAALREAGVLDPVHAGQVIAALSLGCVLAFHLRPAPARPGERAKLAPERTEDRPRVPVPRRASRPDEARSGAVLGQIPLIQAPRSSLDPLAQLRRRMGLRSPSGTERKPARLEAENAFNQGLRMLRESALPGALREFRRAVELLPEEPEYRLLEAWLEYRIAQGDARSLAAAKVRASAQRTLQASRTSARAHSVLGQLALQESDEETAERHLHLAVHYDGSDTEAHRGLRLLEKRKAP